MFFLLKILLINNLNEENHQTGHMIIFKWLRALLRTL